LEGLKKVIFHGHLEHITAIWYISGTFGLFYGQLVYFRDIWFILRPFGNLVAIWNIFHSFGILNKEKSGNPG
jgi:hypothetical protein